MHPRTGYVAPKLDPNPVRPSRLPLGKDSGRGPSSPPGPGHGVTVCRVFIFKDTGVQPLLQPHLSVGHGHLRWVLGAEQACSDLERPLVLKKGVFEVALLFVHSTNVITGRGHRRVSEIARYQDPGGRTRAREWGEVRDMC